jgi:hypothetical protein
MAGKGGKIPGAGRKPGVPNKATREIKEAARMHGPKALKVLSELMMNGTTEQARIAAAKEILDRAYGKATQTIDANVTTNHEQALDALG